MIKEWSKTNGCFKHHADELPVSRFVKQHTAIVIGKDAHDLKTLLKEVYM